MKVEDKNGEAIGRVNDLILDHLSGRVRYSIIASGGVLGMGRSQKLAPVPALSMETAKRGVLALELTRRRWQTLTSFRAEDLARFPLTDRRLPIHEFYGITPSPASTGRDHPPPSLELEFASGLIGKSLSDAHDRDLGRIRDVLVDLSGAKPCFAIFSGGMLKRQERFAVPLQAIARRPDGKMVLAYPPASFEQLPWFARKTWDKVRTESVFRYDDTRPDNTAHNARDAEGPALTPLGQSESRADVRTTGRVRRALAQDAALSMTAKNVKIITLNGRVTLRGPVRTSHEKQRIFRIASKIAGADNVVDQLEIASE